MWQSLNCVPSALPVRWCWAAEPMLMFSEQDAPPSQHIDEKRTWEKKGKDHFSSSALLLAESQGQAAKVVLFTFLTWGWGRKEGMGVGAAGCVRQQVRLGLPCQEVRRACGSYLIYGRAGAQHLTLTFSEQVKRANTENENTLTHLPLFTSFIHWAWAAESGCVCVCVYLCRWTHANFTAAKGEVTSEVKSIHHSEKRCHIKKMLFHGGL